MHRGQHLILRRSLIIWHLSSAFSTNSSRPSDVMLIFAGMFSMSAMRTSVSVHLVRRVADSRGAGLEICKIKLTAQKLPRKPSELYCLLIKIFYSDEKLRYSVPEKYSVLLPLATNCCRQLSGVSGNGGQCFRHQEPQSSLS